MPQPIRAKLLRVHVCESDRYQGAPLAEAIVARCRELGIAGATVFRGWEGFGETAAIHGHGAGGRQHPLVIVVVDSAENIARITAALEPMLETGMLAVSDVETIRVQKSSPQ